MNLNITIKDRHGIDIDLKQRIAVRVTRRGGLGQWWQRKNINHFNYWWVPGSIELSNECTSGRNPYLRISIDKKSAKALSQPMGAEKEEQVVDYINVNMLDPQNFDTTLYIEDGKYLPASGKVH